MWKNVIVFIGCHGETHGGLIPSSSIMNLDIVEGDDVSFDIGGDVDGKLFETWEVSHSVCCDGSCRFADTVDVYGIRSGVDIVK